MAAQVTLVYYPDLAAPGATLIRYLFAEVLDGRNAALADGVMRALERPPRDFAEYVRVTAASLQNSVPVH